MWLRVFGYWLFYAIVGFVLLLMLEGGGGDPGGETNKRIRTGTKAIGALSGAALAIAIACLFADRTLLVPQLVVALGFPLALVLILWTWARLAADLRPRPLGRG